MAENSDTFDLANLNSFIQNANNSLACGYDCQNERQAAKLQEDMYKAQQTLRTAPEDYEKATQAYLTFTKGEKEFSEYQVSNLQKQAEKMANKINQEISKSLEKCNKQIDLNTNLVKNLTYQTEIVMEVQNDNSETQEDATIRSSQIITNERKSYYENEIIASQQFYTQLFSYIYITLVFIYILTASLSFKNEVSWIIHVLVVLFFIFFYTYGKYIFYFLLYFFNKVWSWLPKDVYLTTTDATNNRKHINPNSYYNF